MTPATKGSPAAGRRRAAAAVVALLAGHLFAQAPGGVREHFQMGRGALAEGRLQDAEESFRKALGLDPGVVEARANLGLALFLQGRYSDTVSELTRAAEQRPDLHVAQLFLGLAHLRMGAAAEAIPHLQASLRLDPSNLEARRALSACQLAEGDYAAAVQEFRAAFSATPDAVQGWHALGQDYMRLMSDLAGRLVVGHPDSVWAARLGADMLGLSQAWEAAATYFAAAIGLAPGLPGLNAAFGAALLRLGRADEARFRFEAELRIDPLSEQARAGLAELAIRGGDPATALQHVAAIRDSFPAWLLRAPFPLGSAGRDAATTALAFLEGEKGAPAAFLRWRLSTDRPSADAARQDLEAAVRAAQPREAASAEAQALCAGHLFEECVRAFARRRSLSRADLLLMGRAYLVLAPKPFVLLIYGQT
ncbi:MAG: tetratricopeptide repeat protein, partial [Bryobacterales bacterium]|nr:tetratricopeptide repeat protein [Bryobacterales bacterium]